MQIKPAERDPITLSELIENKLEKARGITSSWCAE